MEAPSEPPRGEAFDSISNHEVHRKNTEIYKG